MQTYMTKYETATTRLMKTAYSLAEHNRPFVAYSELCKLQECNDVDLGVGLHYRYNATRKVDCIDKWKKMKLCKSIISNKHKNSYY